MVHRNHCSIYIWGFKVPVEYLFFVQLITKNTFAHDFFFVFSLIIIKQRTLFLFHPVSCRNEFDFVTFYI